MKFIERAYITLNNEYSVDELAPHFTDKNILIIDDLMSSGKSVSLTVQAILSTFHIKSATILTLLSKA